MATTTRTRRAKTTALERAKKLLHGGVIREDSDDELGLEDLPWQWIYESKAIEEEEPAPAPKGKRKRDVGARIIGAKMGDRFECRVGDCLLIKGEGLKGEAYVGLACEFLEDDGDMKCNVMWFSTEFEIKNQKRKRTDYLEVCGV